MTTTARSAPTELLGLRAETDAGRGERLPGELAAGA